MTETMTAETDWAARAALRCWRAEGMTWTELSEVLAELGVSSERASELDRQLSREEAGR